MAGNALLQDVEWTDQTGKTWKLEDLTDDHRRNLIAWLERRAPDIHLSYLLGLYNMLSTVRGEQAGYDLEDAASSMEDVDPVEWLHELPLLKRLLELEGAKCN